MSAGSFLPSRAVHRVRVTGSSMPCRSRRGHRRGCETRDSRFDSRPGGATTLRRWKADRWPSCSDRSLPPQTVHRATGKFCGIDRGCQTPARSGPIRRAGVSYRSSSPPAEAVAIEQRRTDPSRLNPHAHRFLTRLVLPPACSVRGRLLLNQDSQAIGKHLKAVHLSEVGKSAESFTLLGLNFQVIPPPDQILAVRISRPGHDLIIRGKTVRERCEPPELTRVPRGPAAETWMSSLRWG